jgi:hypothetical protein
MANTFERSAVRGNMSRGCVHAKRRRSASWHRPRHAQRRSKPASASTQTRTSSELEWLGRLVQPDVLRRTAISEEGKRGSRVQGNLKRVEARVVGASFARTVRIWNARRRQRSPPRPRRAATEPISERGDP